MAIELIIFDMDGTLVQSEDCASQALLDVIPALTDSVQSLSDRYRGVKLAEILADIELRLPGLVPSDALDQYRVRENELAGEWIKPTPHVYTLLSTLLVPKCIASNASSAKTRRSLELCGLSEWFQDEIYSAYDVNAWKPDPKLFQYAAACQNVQIGQCMVVEDSAVGIEAAQKAGMLPVLFDPDEKISIDGDVTRISCLLEVLDILR